MSIGQTVFVSMILVYFTARFFFTDWAFNRFGVIKTTLAFGTAFSAIIGAPYLVQMACQL